MRDQEALAGESVVAMSLFKHYASNESKRGTLHCGNPSMGKKGYGYFSFTYQFVIPPFRDHTNLYIHYFDTYTAAWLGLAKSGPGLF